MRVTESHTISLRNLRLEQDTEMRLRVVHCPDPDHDGRAFPLDGRSWTLGRDAEVSIGDSRMSRLHLTVSPGKGGYTVRDLGSRNGTRLEGEPITRDYLVPGALLRAGDTLLVVDAAPPTGQYPAAPEADAEQISELIGETLIMKAVCRTIATAASADSAVLILGATGTGKELVARALHRLSGCNRGLVSVNCGAIASELAEAALFGHVRGAFTGAAQPQPGYFGQADGGMLFLDEIGDMPYPQQVMLLRAIDQQEIMPVGASSARRVAVRVVAATNADVEQTSFRSDLLARLSEWVIELPSLTDRRADILLLWRHFARRQAPDQQAPNLTAEMAEALLMYEWPLNVREIEKISGRVGRVAGQRALWDVNLLPAQMQQAMVRPTPAEQPEPTRAELEAALIETRGNIARMAAKFSRHRAQIYRWLRRHGLDPRQYR